jgi:predicted RND superfamily exporter protein
MNFILILLTVIILIVVIFTIIDKYSALSIYNNNNNDDEILKDDKIFIKYSSIDNKLNTIDDFVNLHYFLNELRPSIYISEIIINNENDNKNDSEKNRILELITSDIQKTKLKYNFNKLKNIFVIIKKINNNIKIILFYDGLLYNSAHFQFKENDYSGYTLVYKIDLKNKIFNHYLQ